MRHIPYGYNIIDGKAVINEEAAEQVRTFFQHYLNGVALTKAAELVGMTLFHGSAGRMLRNKHYLGDDYYPQIIDKETFDKAEKLRQEKAAGLERIREPKTAEEKMPDKAFIFRPAETKYSDPFRQAEYVYGLIESEAQTDGTN
jgi:hypothetical protein